MGCLIMSEGWGWHGRAKSLARRRLGRKLDGCPRRHGSSQQVPSVEFWPHHGASRLYRPGSLLQPLLTGSNGWAAGSMTVL